jgi:hypothetical protein
MSQVVRTNSNLIPPGENVAQYSSAEIQSRVYGSKLVLVVEQMQILTLWLVKTCLLIMYNRMTLVLPQHRIVVATSIYVAVAFVSITSLRRTLYLIANIGHHGDTLLWSLVSPLWTVLCSSDEFKYVAPISRGNYR